MYAYIQIASRNDQGKNDLSNYRWIWAQHIQVTQDMYLISSKF
jgi:hypothetical protein